jgi:hypothetical protein
MLFYRTYCFAVQKSTPCFSFVHKHFVLDRFRCAIFISLIASRYVFFYKRCQSRFRFLSQKELVGDKEISKELRFQRKERRDKNKLLPDFIIIIIIIITGSVVTLCKSHWPRGLMHELSSPARTLGSWVRISLEAWMTVYVYSVFVLLCVGSGLATG